MFNPEGQDRTPSGAVRTMLLAILALSPDGARARRKVQDILWGDYGEEQGARCLRTALSSLRTALRKGLGCDLIEADPQTLRLRIDRLDIDLRESLRDRARAQAAVARIGDDGTMLLEGATLRGSGEAFEDWLREERFYWTERIGGIAQDTAPPPAARTPLPLPAPEPAPVLLPAPILEMPEPAPGAIGGIGLLPPVVSGKTLTAHLFSETLFDALAVNLQSLCGVDIFDYREAAEPGPGCAEGPEFLLRLHYYEDRELRAVTLRVLDAATSRLVVSQSMQGANGGGHDLDMGMIDDFVNQGVDRIGRALEDRRTTRDDPLSISSFHALNRIFRDDGPGLERLERTLEDAYARTGAPACLGLLAYLQTLRVGEHWSAQARDARDTVTDLVARIALDNPSDCIALTCAGHALGYVTHDHEAAGELLRRAVQVGGRLAFCHDHLALHHLYTGRVEEARDAAGQALRLGRYSPLNVTFETTSAMIDILGGDYARGTRAGLRVLSRLPRYGAALRYTAAGLAHLGEHEHAGGLLERIRVLEPGFSLEWLAGKRLALSNPQTEDVILSGLSKAGLK